MNNTLSIRMNEKEQLTHEWLKDFFGLRDTHGEDAQTIKQAETTAQNVLRAFFGDRLSDILQRRSIGELRKIRQEQLLKMLESSTNKQEL